MFGGRAFQADEPQVLFGKYMRKWELRKRVCRIPKSLASNCLPAFQRGITSMNVVFLDESMNAWSINCTCRLAQNDSSDYTENAGCYTLEEGWRQVIEDKGLQPEDWLFFVRFKQRCILIGIRRTSAEGLELLESKLRGLILLHPYQVYSAKLLASEVSKTEDAFALEYVSCIYGMFEAGAASSTTSPNLSLQDFEAIFQMFQERAKYCVGPVEFEEFNLPNHIPRNFCGQDLYSTYRMIEERRNPRLNREGSANPMAQQISHPTSTSSCGHLSQSNFQGFQSREIQTQAGAANFMAPTIQMDAPGIPAYTISDNQISTNPCGYFSQIQEGAPNFTGPTIQMGAPSFPACPASYHQRSTNYSENFSQTQASDNQSSTNHSGYFSETQAGAASFTAPTIQMGAPSFPAYPVLYNQSSTYDSGYFSQTQALQSTEAQAQVVDATSFPAYPASYIQSPRSHYGYVSQTSPQMFQSTGVQTQALQLTGAQTQTGAPDFPCRTYELVSEVLRPVGAKVQESAPSSMASQIQYQTPRTFSEQSSGAQTQLGAPSLMASQIQHGTLSFSFGQDSLPSYGMAQEIGAPNQEAAETRGTQIQAQEYPGNAHSQHGDRASQSSHDIRSPPLELQSGGTEFIPFGTNISPTPQPQFHNPNDLGYVFQTSPPMFQSTGVQTQALQLTGAQTQAGAPDFPCRTYELVSEVLTPVGAQVQESAHSSMASQIQYQTPRTFSEQSSGAQTQLSAPSLMASQIQHGTLSSSFGQDSLPSYGMAQERGRPNQEAAETRGTQIQGQQNPGNAHSQHGNRATQSSHDIRSPSLELQSGGTEFIPFDTNISSTPQTQFHNPNDLGYVFQTSPPMFQSTGEQTQSLQLTGAQTQAGAPDFPWRTYELVSEVLRPVGAQVQASAPSSMASQIQYQTPRSFSEQSSGAQTQLGAPSFMASQNQHCTLSSSCGQYSLPSYGMTQERGAPNQEAAETRGTQIQGQQNPGNAHPQHGNQASQFSHDQETLYWNFNQEGQNSYPLIQTSLQLHNPNDLGQTLIHCFLGGYPHGEGAAGE
ncbi:hypothetical protein SUGI_0954810 [Cryptomeria japonica]|nr:hypothetical protein SUGI_0954810 [Cryptomeria japonica]